MHLWGLHIVDWAVFVGFLLAILAVGIRVSHGVKTQSDFYVGGRKLGRTLQFFLNFGNSTDSTGAVSTAREVYRMGAGGVWLSLQTLFITPFFWFTQVWYRRARAVTMADLFVDRFDSKGLAFGYALFNVFIALFTMGVGNVATFKAAAAMVVKDPSSYTAAERTTVESYAEYQHLKKLTQAGPLSTEDKQRLDVLDNMSKRGELASFISYIKPLPFYIAYSLVIAIYIMLGGLRAAAITDAIQGLLIIVMSVMLIPMGLHEVGGLSGLHSRVPDIKFWLFGTPATSDYTWYSIFAIFLGSFIQIIGILHNMSSGGSARNEDTARFGMISGGFTKRFVIIGWMFCALLAVAILGDGLSDPDNAWGALSKRLLVPGLMGIMLSGMVLGHMPTVGVSAVAVSGLATRNVYEPLFPGRSQKHYLRVGQVAVGVILAMAIAFAMVSDNLLTMVTIMITFNIYFGAAVFLIFFWRRLTWQAVMVGLVLWVVLIGIVPWVMPTSVRRSELMVMETPQGSACYFDKVARVDPNDLSSPKEGLGRFNVEAYALHLMGAPVEKFSSAGVVTTRWMFDSLFPFVVLIVVSLITPRTDPARCDRFYVKMKTPVGATPEIDHDEVEKGYSDPRRFDHEKLFPGTNWEFTKWTMKDVLGFGGCWLIVGAILLFLKFVVSVGSPS